MWSLTEAWRVYAQWQPVAFAQGYVLALFGSTLQTGLGRDCDFVAFPFSENAATPLSLAFALRSEGVPLAHLRSDSLFRQSPRVTVPNAQGFQWLVNGKGIDLLILER